MKRSDTLLFSKSTLSPSLSAAKNNKNSSSLYVRFIILFLMFYILFFDSCSIPVVVNEPTTVPYRTKHFIIYYYDCFFTPAMIEMIGLKKERLLDSINAYLETNYDRDIEVFITDTLKLHEAYASRVEQIHEKNDYALNDDGHEIAHIVSIQKWGYPNPNFLLEGIAVAAEVTDLGSAFVRYQNSIERLTSINPDYLKIELDSIKICLEQNIWNGSYEEYARAGAFIHYLKSEFGIQKVKTWYQSGIPANTSPVMTFANIFNTSLDNEIDKFKSALVSGKIY